MRLGILALAASTLMMGMPPALAALCKDAKGKFTKCPPASGKNRVCKDTKGKFAKCGTPGAKPI